MTLLITTDYYGVFVKPKHARFTQTRGGEAEYN